MIQYMVYYDLMIYYDPKICYHVCKLWSYRPTVLHAPLAYYGATKKPINSYEINKLSIFFP